MANAAAKKAAAAKASAQSFYVPLILVVNVIYFGVRFLLFSPASNSYLEWVALVVNWTAQVYSILGIVDQAGLASGKQKGGKAVLVGGGYLDVLAVTCIVPFAALYISSPVFYVVVILVLPIWGAYSLYRTIRGGGGTSKKR